MTQRLQANTAPAKRLSSGAEGRAGSVDYSAYSAPDEISNLISDRTIREHGGWPGLEQFIQKQLRPVSGVIRLGDK